MFWRVQLEHGCFLSHLTLRRRHVTQDRGLDALGEAAEAEVEAELALGTLVVSRVMLAPKKLLSTVSSAMAAMGREL
jgi:hypothetical protein